MSAENKLLQDAAKDVPPDSSAGDDATNTAASDDPTSPDPGTGKSPGDGSGDAGTGGRSVENVRREFLRKLEKADERAAKLERELNELKTRSTTAEPSATIPTRVEDMSVAQLEVLASQVKPEQKAAFDQLLNNKRVEELVAKQVQSHLGQQNFNTRRAEANQEAFGRYPELHDSGSKLRQLTNQVLGEMGDSAKQNPRAVLDAANEAGMRLGLSPKAGSIMMHQHRTIGGRTAPAPDEGASGEKPMSQEKLDALSKSLASAMPGGKFTPEQLKRIQASSKIYRDNKNLIIRQ